ncbi:TRAP transporter small permease [Halomonas sp. HL-93]|uniref:TRAP transporter small permease n=1 Tax=Halomonas sp. HL-93 TaxID=1666906 RepID=UPI0006DBA15F|nr:TRAP transporter small permease subunit [Halomonas sp. HL-93]KPQ22421.1 MAG: TRAP-type C4-dicarboxylate transport system small permease component [Halomonas sp. HL-93]SBR50583.1 Tripartite ATP-independent transporter, DctQ component [Halomonas sp. HL-93]
MLQRLSSGLARCEETAAAALAAAVTCLILVNIAFRVLGNPLYWISELSIYAMIWMTFLIAGAVFKRRQGVAVTLLSDLLPRNGRKLVGLWVDVMVLVFAVLLVWLCWRWYQPLALAQAGFDIGAFQGQTFNFIYAENTSTLGVKKFWAWLIVPWFALSLSLHGLANLAQSITQWRNPAEEPSAETLL